MKPYPQSLIVWLIGMACILYAVSSEAKVDELSVEYQKFIAPERAYIAEMPGERPKEGLALNMNLSGWNRIVWQNQVHATTTNAQYRLVGWNFLLGIQLTDWAMVAFRHHSQHLLDKAGSSHFPVEDSLYLKLKIYGE